MEKHEADEALRKAIVDHAAAYELVSEGELLGDFMVIAAWIPTNYEEDWRNAYTTHLPDGHLPNHVALGLMELGKRNFLEGEEVD